MSEVKPFQTREQVEIEGLRNEVDSLKLEVESLSTSITDLMTKMIYTMEVINVGSVD